MKNRSSGRDRGTGAAAVYGPVYHPPGTSFFLFLSFLASLALSFVRVFHILRFVSTIAPGKGRGGYFQIFHFSVFLFFYFSILFWLSTGY